MILGILAGITAFVVFIMTRKQQTIWKKASLVVLIMSVLGIFAQYQEEQENILQEEKAALERNPAGEGEQQADLIVNAGDLLSDYEFEVIVPEEKLSQMEAMEKLELAEQEISQTFLGDNPSLGEVREDVVLKTSYLNGLVLADWSFENYDYIDLEGHLLQENLLEEGNMEKAVCELQCGEYAGTYEFYFVIYPRQLSEEEVVLKEIGEAIAKQGEKVSTTELLLPAEADGYALTWSTQSSQAAMKFTILGGIVAAGLWLSEVEKGKKKKKERELHLQLEYPEVVSKLALLLGAGMTLNAAWTRIATSYLNERKKNNNRIRPAYEEMLVTCREIESGIGERSAYEHFGERCGIRCYRKLSGLLVQNVKKGTKGLGTLLEQESEEAFEERKNTARKLGEEAGTKLLLAMMLMLGIVIVLIMIPAVLSFQI